MSDDSFSKRHTSSDVITGDNYIVIIIVIVVTFEVCFGSDELIFQEKIIFINDES